MNSKDTAIYLTDNDDCDLYKNLELSPLIIPIYSKRLITFRDKLLRIEELKNSCLKQEEDVISKIAEYKNLYGIVLKERLQRSKLKQIEDNIKKSKAKLLEKKNLLLIIDENLKKKRELLEKFNEEFQNSQTNLVKHQEKFEETQAKLNKLKRVYVARKIKILYILGFVFFNDQTQRILGNLAQLKNISNTNERTDMKIANGLGFIVMFILNMANYLGLSLPYLLNFAGPRSTIKVSKTEDLSLFLSSKGEKTKFMKAIELLIQDLLQIASFCGISFESDYENEPSIYLLEILLQINKYLTQTIVHES